MTDSGGAALRHAPTPRATYPNPGYVARGRTSGLDSIVWELLLAPNVAEEEDTVTGFRVNPLAVAPPSMDTATIATAQV